MNNNNTCASQHAKHTSHDSPWSRGHPLDKPCIGIGTRSVELSTRRSQRGHQAQLAFESKPIHACVLSDQPQSPKRAMRHPQRQMETHQVPLPSGTIQSSCARGNTQVWQLEHPTCISHDSPWLQWHAHSGTHRERETYKVSLPLDLEPRSRAQGKTHMQQLGKMMCNHHIRIESSHESYTVVAYILTWVKTK